MRKSRRPPFAMLVTTSIIAIYICASFYLSPVRLKGHGGKFILEQKKKKKQRFSQPSKSSVTVTTGNFPGPVSSLYSDDQGQQQPGEEKDKGLAT